MTGGFEFESYKDGNYGIAFNVKNSYYTSFYLKLPELETGEEYNISFKYDNVLGGNPGEIAKVVLLTEEEIAEMSNEDILGITKCSVAAQTELEGVTKCCDTCKNHVLNIMSETKAAQDKNMETFLPYIRMVKDHWYRDVYFVVNKNSGDKNYTGNLDFVDYDYNYEALVDERWTLYETYTNDPADGYKYNPDKAGEFIIYEVEGFRGEEIKRKKHSLVVLSNGLKINSREKRKNKKI